MPSVFLVVVIVVMIMPVTVNGGRRFHRTMWTRMA